MFFKDKSIVISMIAFHFCAEPLSAQLDETCQVTVAGQTVDVGFGGEYRLSNIPAGTNLVRLYAVCTDSAQIRYGRSGFFQVVNNVEVFISELDMQWSTTPFPTTSKIVAVPAAPTLTQIGQTTQITVTAFLSDSTLQDVTVRAFGSTYTSSNTNILTVNQEGLVTATGEGNAFITVINEGATSVAQIAVSLGDPLTIVEGFVFHEDGSPADSVQVTIVETAGIAFTDTSGHFAIIGVATSPDTLTVKAELMIGIAPFVGFSPLLQPVPGGITDAGIITVTNDVLWISGDGFWHIPTNWSTGQVPVPGQDAIIDIPDSVVAVTFSQGNSQIATLLSEERFILSGGSLDAAGTIQVNNEFFLSGGALLNAIVLPSAAGDTITVQTSFSILDGVTINADISFPNGAWVNVINGLTLNGTATCLASTNFSGIFFNDNSTLGGTGEVVFATSGGGNFVDSSVAGYTIASGMTIRGGSGYVGSLVINQGTIQVDGSGTLLLTGPNWVNDGSIEADNNGKLVFNGAWKNQDTVALTDAILDLAGTFKTNDIGTIIVTNSSVNIVGALNNQGDTLAFSASTGSWTLAGGTIDGGAVTGAGGEGLLFRTNFGQGAGTLDSLTLDLDVTFFDNQWVTVTDALILNGVASINSSVSNAFTGFIFSDSVLLDGTGEVVFGSNFSSANSIWGGNLTIGSNMTVRGGSGNFSLSTFTNQGLIRVDGAGETVSLSGTNWVNNGRIEAINNGRLDLKGTFQTSDLGDIDGTGGTVNIVGTLDNTGATLGFNSSTGSWTLAGGTITGGAITGMDGQSLLMSANGLLDSVTLDTDISFPNSVWVNVTNVLTLNGTATCLASTNFSGIFFNDNSTLGGTGEVVFATSGAGNFVSSSVPGFTIASGMTIRGGSGYIGEVGSSFINQGTIRVAGSGENISLGGVNWVNDGTLDLTNQGGITAQGTWTSSGIISIGSNSTFSSVDYTQTTGTTTLSSGTLTATDTVNIQAGDLSGFGSINGDVLMAGQLNPGGSPGILNVSGDYTQNASGAVNIEIGGLNAGTDFDQINLTGTANLDGTLNVSLINGFTPTLGQSFVIMMFASNNGNFSTINGTQIGGGLEFQVNLNPTDLTLVVVQQ